MPAPATLQTESSLVEIFSSIQGEGILVGCRQIFLRFPGCNLSCRYCDTEFAPTEFCRIENPPGSGRVEQRKNPLKLSTIIDLCRAWIEDNPGGHHSFSLTGGEPLLHSELLLAWLPELKRLLPTYLETNGTLPEQLEPLLPHLDWVSMDIKLESLSGQQTAWQDHRRFLELANQTNCYVKMVVAEQTPGDELQRAAELVDAVDQEIPLILQPVTVGERAGVSTRKLLEMQALVARTHHKVRIIPQTHVYLGVM